MRFTVLAPLTLGLALGGGVEARAGSAKKPKRDRGEASMMFAGERWEATSARYRVKKGTLHLSMRKSWRQDDRRMSDSFRITVRDFDGAGTYTVKPTSSFTRVGANVKKLEEAAGDDAATTKAVMGMFRGSKVHLLRGMELVITDVTDAEIRGTFAHDSNLGEPMTEGRFRAVKRKPRKKRKRTDRSAR